MRYTLILLYLVCILLSCSEDKLDIYEDIDQELSEQIASVAPTQNADFYILPYTNNLQTIPQDAKNPLSPSKVELGKLLFFETGLAMDARKPSGMGTYSCASCHIPEAGFRPGRMQGIADGGMGFGDNGEFRIMNEDYTENELDIQAARPLNLVNVAFVKNTFWNGQFGSKGVNVGTEDVWNHNEDTKRNHLGYEGIETQNIEGMQTHRMLVDKTMMKAYGYIELFDQSFPEYGQQFRYSNFTASLAISAYLRTVISDDAPFQHWLRGNKNALSLEEKKGAMLFFGKANCSNCHYEKNLGSLEFHALGVKDMDQNHYALNKDPNDKRNFGRGGFTLKQEDMYKFKVPGIYNMKDTPFYFHGSSKTSLREVVEYKLNAESENIRVPQKLISPKLIKTSLTDSEITDLVAFLENGLRDPNLVRYKPEYLGSGFCYPNNDYISQADLSCE